MRRSGKSDFPRPALTVDVVLFAGAAGSRAVLLVKRQFEPFEGAWALPGGFVEEGERLSDAARRELAEETGVVFTGALKQLGAWGDPGRDPRGWTVSVVFRGDTGTRELPETRSGDDAAEAAWWPLDAGLPPAMAFDHAEILSAALGNAGGRART